MDTVSGIGVLDKTMAILGAVAEEPIGLRGLVERTGISRATTHRLASGMESLGLLRRHASGAFALGPALIGLGRAAAEEFPLGAIALPFLRTLRDQTAESTQLFVVDEDERLCVAAADSSQELRTIVPVGTRLPMARGSAGRVLTGQIGPDGWTDSVAERAPGVASVSAPVRDGGDRLLGAVSVSGPVDRLGPSPGERFGSAVVAAANGIERALGGS